MMKLIKTIKSKVEWPEHAVTEVNNARASLQAEGFLTEPVMWVSGNMMDALYMFLRSSHVTYYNALKDNNLCCPKVKEVPDTEVHLLSGNGVVIIKDIKINLEKKCHYCPNTFKLNQHRNALSGGRLLCEECYDKVFESALGK